MTVTDPETLQESEDGEHVARRLRWARERELRAPRSPQHLSTADVFTLGNAVCGFLAIYFTTTGVLIPHLTGETAGGDRRSAAAAVTLLLIGSMCDLADGLVARKLRSSALGAELDNLADLISFGIAPAYFVVVWGMVTPGANQRLSAGIAIVVLLAVVLRLARFSCTTMRPGVFQGMPCPMGAMTVISIVLLNPPFIPAVLGIVAVAALMVSKVEYPKPHGVLATATLCWIVVSMGCLTAWATGVPGGHLLLQVGASLQVSLALMAPLMVIRRKVGDVRARRAESRTH
ncbi:phosphatidylcholine/phosphatidylserine synthase [Streptacidiphilus sp. P02-A3a]|uniref:CDP-alcohol phosphatidyltransferase family protein n=1 Tax=Streptacidiphilus sp. P02-A3a TaxID=2704468 RepID=UPI00351A0687